MDKTTGTHFERGTHFEGVTLISPTDGLEQALKQSLNVINEQRRQKIAGHVRGIVEALGLDPEDQHFGPTPDRAAKMLMTFIDETEDNLAEILSAGFEESSDNMMVTQTLIPFSGLCAHHLLPFWGDAAIAYLPKKRIVGLSKLTRLVYAAGRISPSTQEDITAKVADTLSSVMEPAGVAVITRAVHGCMSVRGVRAPNTHTVVSAMRGLFLHAPQTRSEFMSIVEGSWRG